MKRILVAITIFMVAIALIAVARLNTNISLGQTESYLVIENILEEPIRLGRNNVDIQAIVDDPDTGCFYYKNGITYICDHNNSNEFSDLYNVKVGDTAKVFGYKLKCAKVTTAHYNLANGTLELDYADTLKYDVVIECCGNIGDVYNNLVTYWEITKY